MNEKAEALHEVAANAKAPDAQVEHHLFVARMIGWPRNMNEHVIEVVSEVAGLMNIDASMHGDTLCVTYDVRGVHISKIIWEIGHALRRFDAPLERIEVISASVAQYFPINTPSQLDYHRHLDRADY